MGDVPERPARVGAASDAVFVSPPWYTSLRVLLVDASGPDRLLARTALSREGQVPYELYECGTAQEAEALSQKHPLDAILLDYRLPDGDGLVCLEQLVKQLEDVAVLMIAREGNESAVVQAFKAGAADYLIKDQVLHNPAHLDRAIREAVYAKRLERENQRLLSALHERNQELERINRRFWEMSHTDELTGFYNRRFITTRLDEEISRSHRYRLPLSLVIVDLDHFKQINDHFGHPIGDQVLQTVARLFREVLRETDLVGRYGGEEFMMVLTNTHVDGAVVFCNRVRERLEAASLVTVDETPIQLTASFGIAGYTLGDESCEDMIRIADQNLYLAKAQGRNRVVASQQTGPSGPG